ncbi:MULTISPECIES: restriction endonuclease subunit S [unclassified Hydrogenobaculum]|uniref:restriction endonuclease subunit S n=1 Tax=unclassified Hydrogenobaculum TaxID=2622382 RepID=UPI0001C506A3|nr:MULTISPECIES: restriction endonuclease subunit S [unclassified Hydrogenobaculum]AEF18516.1 restriction modification system DNA specificity domain protein [Hydrogenobaculum sp. 3684]AEG45804.1 restriction modification system DNA specificity domain protein [Hydrogenobaculum sp. SHO]AGG14446.1 restriction modification system DNA specificity domain containing protein [Hydrogenobaculum sp. HO]AGH92750.1 restriction endonuclease S subunit [Hydrogenobaculum sp. SN]
MSGDKEFKEFENLPEGWKWVRLEEVIEKTYPGEWGDNPTDSKNIFPVFSTLAIDYDGRIDFTKAIPRKLNKKKIEKLKLRKGMILIEKSGGSTDIPAGKVAILKQDFEGTCSNFIQILKPNNNACNSYYLFYRLLYNFKNNLTEKYQQKTTGIINFILKEYFNEYIPLPPLPEQQKIAEILETIDNAIEKTDKIIEKYKRIKQGLMQDLLTKGIDENGNIRDEKTHKFKDSTLGRIPEEWEVVRLGEIGEIITGSTPPTENSEYYGDEYLFISPEDIQNKKYIVNTTKKLTKLGMNIQRKISPMSICVVCIGSTIGKIAITKYECSTNQQINTIIPNLKLYDPEALYYFINFHIQSPLKIEAGLQAVPIVNKSAFSKIPLPLPPLPEQQRIAEILSQTDQTIEKEQQYKEKLQRTKQGLMQDLLTGKVRVNHLVEEEEK